MVQILSRYQNLCAKYLGLNLVNMGEMSGAYSIPVRRYIHNFGLKM